NSRIMSGLREVLKDAVLSVLPSLSPDVTSQLVEKLMDQGVEGLDDLIHVKEDDILEFIRPIQCRKLLGVLPLVPSEASTTPDAPPSSSSSTSASSPGSTGVSHSWPENFKVPWNLMPAGIQNDAIENGHRPSLADRRQMIRILADEMRKHEENPNRSQCLTVTRQIVGQYTKTFADMVGDRQIGGGHASLLTQLKVRIEHLNRKSTLSHHRTQRSETGTTKKRSSTDSYGCTSWQPTLPPGESYESLEVKRQKMEEIHRHEGISGAQRGDVCKLMEETYCLQRQMINEIPSPTTADLRTKRPYLFTQRHIYGNFEMLTDKKVHKLLELSIQEDYLTCHIHCSMFYLSVLLMTVVLFSFKFFQEFATPSDVQQSVPLPESSRLIILGNKITPCFPDALYVYFVWFHVFSIEIGINIIVIFVVCFLPCRRFLDINPERGSETKKGKVTSKKTGQVVQKKNTTVNPQVSSLLRKLADFEWNFV
uniref:Uncharacterized protein n=1 Tax=Sinocyclocheilus grahami TaxID=75366 RepID=A0A672KZC7_SINGR